MKPVTVSWQSRVVKATISLPASKSESNRCLIIQALAGEGVAHLDNLSDARDTHLLQQLLTQVQTREQQPLSLYAQDAGTTLRFITAFCAAMGVPAHITGTARMMQRPVGPLTTALKALGAELFHPDTAGFPPIITGTRRMQGGRVAVRGDVSSQFITALLLVGPMLPLGLTLEITGELHSRPYVEMTLALMRHFGAEADWQGAMLTVAPTGYRKQHYAVEADWSAASYWYAVAALSAQAEIHLPGLRSPSLQGDSRIAQLMQPLGIQTIPTPDGVLLVAPPDRVADASPRLIDFSHTPDLAQTMAVVVAALGLPWQFCGLQSLRIKETDRIAALQHELGAFGGGINETASGIFTIMPFSSLSPDTAAIQTWEDHRMAMAFAVLSITGTRLVFDDAAVVAKSYPRFWQQLTRAGAEVSES